MARLPRFGIPSIPQHVIQRGNNRQAYFYADDDSPCLPETPQTVRYRVTAPFRLEPLHGQHDRSRFASGEEALDRYFRTQVTQDIRRRIANCFVAVDVATG